MDKKRYVEYDGNERKSKRQRTELSDYLTLNLQNCNPERESGEEPSDASFASNKRINIHATAGNKRSVTPIPEARVNRIIIQELHLNQTVPKIGERRTPMKFKIGLIISDDHLDDSMRLFTLNKDYDETNNKIQCTRQKINYHGASTVYFTYSSWLLFVITPSRGWTPSLIAELFGMIDADLVLNCKRKDDQKETLFPKQIGDQNLMDPSSHFLDWRGLCSCGRKDEHFPRMVEDAPYVSEEDPYIPLLGNQYAIFYPDSRIATCCASWLFSGTMVNRHKYIFPVTDSQVVVQLTIKADITDEDFTLKLNLLAAEMSAVFILLEKTNSTKIIAVLQPQVWISIWASYYSGNNGKDGVLHVRPPKVLSWANLPTLELLDAPTNSMMDLLIPSEVSNTTNLVFCGDSVDFDCLGSFTCLQSLHLLNSHLAGDFSVISKLVKLDTLRLDYCHNLSNECLLNLVNLKLTSLSVNGCQWFDNQSSRYLSQIDTLKELSLRNCYGVTNIDGFSFVDVLDISGCWQIFSEVIQDFKKKWPHVHITKQFEYATHPMDDIASYNWTDIYREQILTQSP